MRTWQSVNINLLKYVIQHGMMKAFCLFLLVKANFPKHTVFRDYSPERMAKRFKWLKHEFRSKGKRKYQKVSFHPKTIDRYIKKLINAGFCVMQDNQLVFRNMDKICKDLGLEPGLKKKISIRPWKSIYQVQLSLYNLLLKINTEQQEFNGTIRCGFKIGNMISNAETRKAIQLHKDKKFLKPLPEANVDDADKFFSCRQSARLFKCSHVTANVILNALHREKFLKAKMRIEPWEKSASIENFFKIKNDLNETLPGFFYFRNGNIYRHRGRILRFLI